MSQTQGPEPDAAVQQCEPTYPRSPSECLPIFAPRKKLSPEIQILADRAAGGSYEALQALVVWMQHHKLTARQAQLLPILYNCFDKKPANPDPAAAKRTAVALDGITQTFLWEQTIEAIGTSSTLARFTESWPAIWKWIHYHHNRIYPKGLFCVNEQPLVEGSDDFRTVLTIRRLLSVVFDDKFPVGAAMLATPGFFLLFADVWARLCETLSQPKYSTIAYLGITCKLAYVLGSDFDHYARLLVKGLGGDVARLATLCLNNLKMAINDEGDSMPAMLPLVTLITNLANEVPTLGNAFLSQHSIIEVSRALAFSVADGGPMSNKADPDHNYAVQSRVLSCLTYLESAIMVSDGITWTIQAIRSRLIQSLLMCPALPQDKDPGSTSYRSIQRIAVDVVDIMTKYLIYRSVLKQVQRAMEDPNIPALEAAVPRDGKFWKTWETFKALIAKRIIVKNIFDQSEKYSQDCSASQCKQVEALNDFKLCGGCQETIYCSKSCQVRDWKSGKHREVCEAIRKRRANGQASRVSRNDEKLIRKNVTYDIHLYRANIVHALSMLFIEAGTDILGYLIYIDYCVLPLLICVDLTEKFPRYASKGIGSNEETENLGAPTSHVAISYPHGTRHHFIVLDLEKGGNALWLKQALIGEGIPLPHMNDVGDPKDIVLGGADRLPADLLAKDLESLRLERSVDLGVGG